jgi:DNA-binding response OmpR family regulator
MQPQVLLIEDQVGLREILEINFRSAGYRVLSAGDGVTAWHKFDQEHPDLLVLDLNLPQMSGFRLAGPHGLRLRRSRGNRPTPA